MQSGWVSRSTPSGTRPNRRAVHGPRGQLQLKPGFLDLFGAASATGTASPRVVVGPPPGRRDARRFGAPRALRRGRDAGLRGATEALAGHLRRGRATARRTRGAMRGARGLASRACGQRAPPGCRSSRSPRRRSGVHRARWRMPWSPICTPRGLLALASGASHSTRRSPRGSASPKNAARSRSRRGRPPARREGPPRRRRRDEAPVDLGRTRSQTSRARSPVRRASRTAAAAAVGTASHFSRSRWSSQRSATWGGDDVMHARVRRHARAQTSERRPEARVAVGPRPLEDPAPELGAPRRRDALERRRHVERVVERRARASSAS